MMLLPALSAGTSTYLLWSSVKYALICGSSKILWQGRKLRCSKLLILLLMISFTVSDHASRADMWHPSRLLQFPYDPKRSTYMDEQFLFYKISNFQKREKDVTVMPSGNPCMGILTRGQNHFGCAGQKDRSSGNESKNRPLGYFFMRNASVASNLQTNLFIAARCVSFSTTLFFFNVLVFILWGYLDYTSEVRKTIVLRHIYVFITITWSKVADVFVTFRYFSFPIK